MRQGLGLFESTGSALNATYYLALLAEAHAEAGQVVEGLRVVDEAFERLRRGGERWWEAELYRLRGLLRSRHANPRRRDVAAADLRRALAVARREHARPLELRAAAALRSLGGPGGGPRACQSSS
jgi:predicted ATPase